MTCIQKVDCFVDCLKLFNSTLISLLFQEQTDDYTFVIFLALMLLFTVYVFVKMPETKDKTIEEIVHQYSPGGVLDVEEALDADDAMASNDCDVFENVRRSDGDTQSSSTVSPEEVDLLEQRDDVDDVV